MAAGATFYIDRAIRRTGPVYSWAAAGAVAIILLAEGDFRYVGLLWLLFAGVNLETALRWRLPEFRWPAYVIGALGVAHVFVLDVIAVRKPAEASVRVTLFCASLICYLAVGRLFRSLPDRFSESERGLVRDTASWAGAAFAAALLWTISADALVAVAWTALALALIEAGVFWEMPIFRRQGDVLAVLVVGRVFFANFTNHGASFGISHRLLTIVPIIAAFYCAWLRYSGLDGITGWDRRARGWFTWAGAALTVLLLRFEMGRGPTVAGWSIVLVALFWLGTRNNWPDFGRQALLLAALAFWRAWVTNFYLPGAFGGVPLRIWTGGAVVAALYACHIMAPRNVTECSWIERHQRAYFAVLGSVLLAVLLYYEVSGGLLTVALGLEAMLLLGAGFALHDRVPRLLALGLFFLCIGKLFFYDLRNLETIHRILSFIVLGAIMVAVSWVYTRFRAEIRKFL